MSQLALLEQKMWAVGCSAISLSRLPAGTTSNWPFICRFGTADPHSWQKPFECLVSGRVKVLTWVSPATHFNFADAENKLAAWAEPVSFWQCLQWHKKKLSKTPSISNWIRPHKQDPRYFLFIVKLCWQKNKKAAGGCFFIYGRHLTGWSTFKALLICTDDLAEFCDWGDWMAFNYYVFGFDHLAKSSSLTWVGNIHVDSDRDLCVRSWSDSNLGEMGDRFFLSCVHVVEA